MFTKEKALDVVDAVLVVLAFPAVLVAAAVVGGLNPDLLDKMLATESGWKTRLVLASAAGIYLGGTALLFFL